MTNNQLKERLQIWEIPFEEKIQNGTRTVYPLNCTAIIIKFNPEIKLISLKEPHVC